MQSSETRTLRLAMLASAAGTLLEWYDLYLAIILARVLSNRIFPGGESTYFLETLAIVGSSFFVRPLGSLFFGSLGDRKGRKRSFILSLLLMGGATFLIGLLPDFAHAGWWAPVMLLVLRLTQGFALSGEYSGAIIYVAETAPPEKRGFYTGFIQATVPLGLLLCLSVVILVQNSMSVEDFNTWGWRIPFLSSAVLVVFSYLIRRKMGETPVFTRLQSSGGLSASPVKESLGSGSSWRRILNIVFGGNAAQSTIMQTAQFVTLYFLQRAVKMDEQLSLMILASALLLGAPFFQLAAKWSDRFGRRKVIYSGLLLASLSIPAAFYLYFSLGNAVQNPAVLALFILFAWINTFAGALVYGPMGIYVMECFEGRTRYTGMGFTHNLGNGVLGGATPLITEWLKSRAWLGPVLGPYAGLLYPMLLIVIALIWFPLVKPALSQDEPVA